MKPLTVVTPTLNSVKTIGPLYDSLSKIAFLLEEWIIVDSFSVDNIRDFCEEANRHIRTILIQVPANGPYNAMNHGIKIALTEYIWIINSDDYIHSFSADSFVRALNKKPDVIHGRVLRCYSNQTIFVGGPSFASPLFLRLNEVHPSVIVSRNIYNSFGVFDERYRVAADLDFFLRLLPRKKSLITLHLSDLEVFFSVGGISFHHDESAMSYLRMLASNRVSLLFFVWFISRRIWGVARKIFTSP